MKKQYDFMVIGGGSGGIAAARRAAEYGAQVLLIETGRLGGTCVNVGCVPKKVMWLTSQIRETLDMAGNYGFDVSNNGFDWATVKHSRDSYIKRLNGIYGRNLDKSGVELVEGVARFTDDRTIEVNGDTCSATHILIATGGRPAVPEVPGAELGITSDGFFELEQQPRRVLVIGAGYIATELAGLMHGLGSDVSILLRKDKLLRSFDQDVHEMVMREMVEAGVRILPNVALEALIRQGDSLGYRDRDGAGRDEYDCIIWAVGRSPNVEPLELGVTGVRLDERGYIETDEFQNTTVNNIYAVGDVTRRAQLTPVAIAAGRRLADRLFDNQSEARLDYDNIPTVIFAHPPVGTVGLSEAQAIEKYGADSIRIYKNHVVDMYFAMAEHKPKTLLKLIVQGENERVVGCHVVGRSADEMIQGFAVAVKMGATKKDFDNTVAIHPTAAEELVTLR